jgi:hypothetical protein
VSGAVSTLVDVRRGADPDVLEFLTDDGTVWLARAWGVHPDEQRRTREAIVQLVRGVLAPSR